MNGTYRRRLAIKRETLRRLAAGDLSQVAGGRARCCTYGVSGCQGNPNTDTCSPPEIDTKQCGDSNCCQ